jgi:Ser-tRNA(Ala) deacylase AlaX
MSTRQTFLKYLGHSPLLKDSAQIIDIITEGDKAGIILDKTIFYPQGGGQPFDQGKIIDEASSREFEVKEVRFKDGIVYHFGSFYNGSFDKGAIVTLQIDENRRLLNSRNHSAGHLVDLALNKLGYTLKPTKGYHFPVGAYVEYEGNLDEKTRATLKQQLENELNALVQAMLPITIKFLSLKELKNLALDIPDDLPTNKPLRVMIVEGYPAIACGGTHVKHTKEIGSITITKIKNKKGDTRISYQISD